MNLMTIAEPMRRRRWAGYLLAIVMTIAEFSVFDLYLDIFRDFPFILPVTAVTIVAFLGGWAPAMLVAVVSEPYIQYYVIAPYRSFALSWPAGYVGIGFYLFLCAIITVLMHGVFAANGALQVSQDSLKELNDQLEMRVTERTATLRATEAELRATNQNLEGLVEARVGDLRIANEEIQRFAYIVSHDLRAPLVNVLGFTSELDALRGDLGDFLAAVEAKAPELVTADRRMAVETDLPEALGFIRSSTQKMDRLINAILKLSREGRRKLTPEAIDVTALVEVQGESLSQQFSAREAELVIEGALPSLVSDRLAIEQIFGNLIENAVKYLATDRPGRIAVSGGPEGSLLRYEIADNGRGIDPKDFERIFELFRRAGEQNTAGEGIGLAYVRNLARRLGGNVTVRSEMGVGSTFVVTLPATLRAQVEGDDEV